MVALLLAHVALTKSTPAVYDHTPWREDPYDVAVSFAPLVAVAGGVALALRLLAERAEPRGRRRYALRAAALVLGTVLGTAAVEWVAVALGTQRADWTAATGVAVASLGVTTAGAVAAALGLWHAGRGSRPDQAAAFAAVPGPTPCTEAPPVPDLLDDALVVARSLASRSRPARRPLLAVIATAERWPLPLLRRHPIGTSAAGSLLVGVLIATGQFREGDGLGVATLLFVGVGACTTFAIAVPAGAWLGVLGAESPGLVQPGPAPVRHRGPAPGRVAAVAGCTAVPLVVAFRADLGWARASEAAAPLIVLCAVVALAVAGAAWACARRLM